MTARWPENDWYLVHTHHQQELKLCQTLHNQSQTYFCPLLSLVRRRSSTSSSTKLVSKPLFPRYLFVFGSLHVPQILRKTHLIVSCSRVTLQGPLHSCLTTLQHALVHPELAASARVVPPTHATKPGDRIWVLPPHPLSGLLTTVHDLQGKASIIIQIPVLGTAVAFTIRTDQYELADDPLNDPYITDLRL